jgi:hypothetical protein
MRFRLAIDSARAVRVRIAANTFRRVVVANRALRDLTAIASNGWFLRLESPILNCFHSRFCMDAGVVDPQYGGCQQP